MAYSYKQWTQDQTADNVIHASDLERWQDGITDAGGTWDGSWTDEKDTLTADQLNALETEIASLYGTGFTAKTWEDGQVPGVDEWNRIEDAINTILNRTAFAIYCETDNSLTFYVDYPVPSAGETYNGKTVTNVYTGFVDREFTSVSNQPWGNRQGNVYTIDFNSSFKLAQPIALAFWFQAFSNLTSVNNSANVDTSKVTTMQYLFYNCSSLPSLDLSSWDTSSVTDIASALRGMTALTTLNVSGWDTSNVTNMQSTFRESGFTSITGISSWDTSSVTNMQYLFYSCSSLTSLDLSSWDTSSVTNIQYLFSGCSSIVTLDLSSWDTSSVTNMAYSIRNMSALTTVYAGEGQFNIDNVTNDTQMFTNSSKLVGGNGTMYSSSNVGSSMAHIDTEDNPGYFTAKG